MVVGYGEGGGGWWVGVGWAFVCESWVGWGGGRGDEVMQGLRPLADHTVCLAKALDH